MRSAGITDYPTQHGAHPAVLARGINIAEVPHPTHLDQERAVGVRRTLDAIGSGRPGFALYQLVRSVQRQAAIEGLGHVNLQPTCPCGGRCLNSVPIGGAR